ncbi:hypothetical protein A3F27_00010 [Candidatus Kaiserbacteria bacterium RIFCSPHIGHO2_12_FULL_53_13]|uniref:Uncharacterized protein n=1 Tax=Candidatus Kaiserbacteria bacterium RIFCSPHIGHO2_12_FULL_53_13 TaxID=1798502 RepID=A0A1F6EC29_9BACT|nr:MAG: hypothetical protein A3F27_00010 [Candidatus Kaiserbacteria bacterium RIFCSPHIGHO2_12_FULL_53_13]OGG74277.1 MAG: hypothetical protein A3A37_03075 [Candidatus Kaiserbacteria bacterium RIFCSPLOWO2_01_FULL_52_36]
MRKRGLTLRKTLLFSALIIGAGAGVSVYKLTSTHQGAVVVSDKVREITYPVQYSDGHITENAIVSDPRFRNTATLEGARLLALANILSFVPRSAREDGPVQMEKGTWLWTPLLKITPEYRDSIISGAKHNGIRNIYLSIDSYLDIYTLPDGPKKDGTKKKFDDALEKFITQARKNGMTVDAEGGWRNWAEPGHEYKAFAVLEYAVGYNRTHAEKLRGFQYDVEPYLLESYKENKKSTLHRFVALMQASMAKLSDSDLALSVAIPEFYDGSQDGTPKYFYGFRYGYTLDHLLGVLDRRPGSKIIVMAYRNFAEGENGIIEISKNEIDEAARYRTKIVVAGETGDVLPSYITFHNTSRSHYDEQLGVVEKALAGEKSYGGMSTHYINTLLALK